MQILPLNISPANVKTNYINFGAKKNNKPQPAQQSTCSICVETTYYPHYSGIKSKTFLEQTSNEDLYHVYHYDTDQKLVSKEIKVYSNDRFQNLLREHNYNYNDNGILTKKETYTFYPKIKDSKSYLMESSTVETYDDCHKLVERVYQSYSPEKIVKEKNITKRNPDGSSKCEVLLYNDNGGIEQRKITQKNDKNKVTKVIEINYDENGEIISTSTTSRSAKWSVNCSRFKEIFVKIFNRQVCEKTNFYVYRV